VTPLIPLIFIATVPWRSENLKALLAIVEPQAKTIVLHGVPPGARWREAAKHDGLAIVLDDDHLVDQHYVRRCLATYARLKAPFAWAGYGRNGVYVTHDKPRTTDVELVDLAAGHAVVPTAMLDRLEADPQASFYLGYDGHDEAFVSWHLRARGCQLWRPAGPSGVTCVRSLHHDKRAQWRRDPGKYARLRAELAKRPVDFCGEKAGGVLQAT
jgi:hypothetical protein